MAQVSEESIKGLAAFNEYSALDPNGGKGLSAIEFANALSAKSDKGADGKVTNTFTIDSFKAYFATLGVSASSVEIMWQAMVSQGYVKNNVVSAGNIVIYAEKVTGKTPDFSVVQDANGKNVNQVTIGSADKWNSFNEFIAFLPDGQAILSDVLNGLSVNNPQEYRELFLTNILAQNSEKSMPGIMSRDSFSKTLLSAGFSQADVDRIVNFMFGKLDEAGNIVVASVFGDASSSRTIEKIAKYMASNLGDWKGPKGLVDSINSKLHNDVKPAPVNTQNLDELKNNNIFEYRKVVVNEALKQFAGENNLISKSKFDEVLTSVGFTNADERKFLISALFGNLSEYIDISKMSVTLSDDSYAGKWSNLSELLSNLHDLSNGKLITSLNAKAFGKDSSSRSAAENFFLHYASPANKDTGIQEGDGLLSPEEFTTALKNIAVDEKKTRVATSVISTIMYNLGVYDIDKVDLYVRSLDPKGVGTVSISKLVNFAKTALGDGPWSFSSFVGFISGKPASAVSVGNKSADFSPQALYEILLKVAKEPSGVKTADGISADGYIPKDKFLKLAQEGGFTLTEATDLTKLMYGDRNFMLPEALMVKFTGENKLTWKNFSDFTSLVRSAIKTINPDSLKTVLANQANGEMLPRSAFSEWLLSQGVAKDKADILTARVYADVKRNDGALVNELNYNEAWARLTSNGKARWQNVAGLVIDNTTMIPNAPNLPQENQITSPANVTYQRNVPVKDGREIDWIAQIKDFELGGRFERIDGEWLNQQFVKEGMDPLDAEMLTDRMMTDQMAFERILIIQKKIEINKGETTIAQIRANYNELIKQNESFDVTLKAYSAARNSNEGVWKDSINDENITKLVGLRDTLIKNQGYDVVDANKQVIALMQTNGPDILEILDTNSPYNKRLLNGEKLEAIVNDLKETYIGTGQTVQILDSVISRLQVESPALAVALEMTRGVMFGSNDTRIELPALAKAHNLRALATSLGKSLEMLFREAGGPNPIVFVSALMADLGNYYVSTIRPEEIPKMASQFWMLADMAGAAIEGFATDNKDIATARGTSKLLRAVGNMINEAQYLKFQNNDNAKLVSGLHFGAEVIGAVGIFTNNQELGQVSNAMYSFTEIPRQWGEVNRLFNSQFTIDNVQSSVTMSALITNAGASIANLLGEPSWAKGLSQVSNLFSIANNVTTLYRSQGIAGALRDFALNNRGLSVSSIPNFYEMADQFIKGGLFTDTTDFLNFWDDADKVEDFIGKGDTATSVPDKVFDAQLAVQLLSAASIIGDMVGKPMPSGLMDLLNAYQTGVSRVSLSAKQAADYAMKTMGNIVVYAADLLEYTGFINAGTEYAEFVGKGIGYAQDLAPALGSIMQVISWVGFGYQVYGFVKGAMDTADRIDISDSAKITSTLHSFTQLLASLGLMLIEIPFVGWVILAVAAVIDMGVSIYEGFEYGFDQRTIASIALPIIGGMIYDWFGNEAKPNFQLGSWNTATVHGMDIVPQPGWQDSKFVQDHADFFDSANKTHAHYFDTRSTRLGILYTKLSDFQKGTKEDYLTNMYNESFVPVRDAMVTLDGAFADMLDKVDKQNGEFDGNIGKTMRYYIQNFGKGDKTTDFYERQDLTELNLVKMVNDRYSMIIDYMAKSGTIAGQAANVWYDNLLPKIYTRSAPSFEVLSILSSNPELLKLPPDIIKRICDTIPASDSSGIAQYINTIVGLYTSFRDNPFREKMNIPFEPDKVLSTVFAKLGLVNNKYGGVVAPHTAPDWAVKQLDAPKTVKEGLLRSMDMTEVQFWRFSEEYGFKDGKQVEIIGDPIDASLTRLRVDGVNNDYRFVTLFGPNYYDSYWEQVTGLEANPLNNAVKRELNDEHFKWTSSRDFPPNQNVKRAFDALAGTGKDIVWIGQSKTPGLYELMVDGVQNAYKFENGKFIKVSNTKISVNPMQMRDNVVAGTLINKIPVRKDGTDFIQKKEIGVDNNGKPFLGQNYSDVYRYDTNNEDWEDEESATAN